MPRYAFHYKFKVLKLKSHGGKPSSAGITSTWVKDRLVVHPGEWTDLPVNRRLRKMMRREGFAVNMFAGESSGFTLARALQQLGAKEGWFLELDILRGEGHDLLCDKGAYSGLLRLLWKERSKPRWEALIVDLEASFDAVRSKEDQMRRDR